MTTTTASRVALFLFALTLACVGSAGCAEAPVGAPPPPATPDALDPCGGACTEVQLCVKDSEGVYGCAYICANQLHCWSGCCLPLEDTGYNVCRPSAMCYGP